MKQVTQNRRVLRITPEVHRQVKAQAAAEDRTLADLAAEVLTEALERRRRQRDKIAVSMATPQPVQTRG